MFVFSPFNQTCTLSCIKIQMCPWSCITRRQSLQTNNTKKDFWSDIQRLHLLSGVQRRQGSGKTEDGSKGWQLEECKVQCQLFRKDQFKLKGLESKAHNSDLWQEELIQPCQRSQRKHSYYDFNSKINVPLLTPLAFFISGPGAVQKSSVIVRVSKVYQVRWNTILFTIRLCGPIIGWIYSKLCPISLIKGIPASRVKPLSFPRSILLNPYQDASKLIKKSH